MLLSCFCLPTGEAHSSRSLNLFLSESVFIQQLSPSPCDMEQEGGEGHILPDLFSASVAVTAQGNYGPFLCPPCCCCSDSHCRLCCLPAWRLIKSWQCLLTVAGILFPFSAAGDYWSSSSAGSEQFHPMSRVFQKPFSSFHSPHSRIQFVWSHLGWVIYKCTFQHLWIHHSVLHFISTCPFPLPSLFPLCLVIPCFYMPESCFK